MKKKAGIKKLLRVSVFVDAHQRKTKTSDALQKIFRASYYFLLLLLFAIVYMPFLEVIITMIIIIINFIDVVHFKS